MITNNITAPCHTKWLNEIQKYETYNVVELKKNIKKINELDKAIYHRLCAIRPPLPYLPEKPQQLIERDELESYQSRTTSLFHKLRANNS